MPRTYSVTGSGKDLRLTPSPGSGLPVIKIGGGLSGVNLQSLAELR
jgi:hypothetical protein